MAHAAGDAHDFIIYGAHNRLVFPILDADGDLVTGASSLDSEVSIDNGTFADCTNEATEIATSSGMYSLDLTGAECTGKVIAVIVKSASGKTTPFVLYPKRLVVLETGTAQAGGSNTLRLQAGSGGLDDSYNGLYVRITNNSPSGAQYQARKIIDYDSVSLDVTVDSNWGTNPSSSSTYEILIPEHVSVQAWVNAKVVPNVAGYPKVDVGYYGGTAGTFTSGRPNVNASHLGGTSQTGRDVGASVLLSPGTGTGQISLSSGAVLLQATQTGVTIPTVTTLTNAPSDSSGVTTLLSRVPSGIFTGITSLAQWLGLLAGKQSGNSTARTELRATGAGSGSFDETTDSLEAVRDNVGTNGAALSLAKTTNITGFNDLNAAGVRSAVGLASANLDTQLDALPTAVEINTEVDTALADYDAPTKAELDAAVAPLATTADLATVAGYVDTEVAAIKATTDKLNTAVELDGSVYRFTENALEQAPAGGGTAPTVEEIGDEMETRELTLTAAYDAAKTAASQTSVDDLPTNAELSTALAAADDAVLAAVAALVIPTSAANASAVRTELATELARIDAAVSSRLASSSYTAPANADITAIKAKTDALPASPAAVSDVPTAGQNAAALLDLTDGVETGVTPRAAFRLVLAALAGELSGAGTTTITIRNVGDTKDRITATVDGLGNRTAVTVDAT